MERKDGFDVLRLIEHGSICYISSEYVSGKQLVYWLKDGMRLEKGVLFQWVRDMVKQLGRIYRCQGNQGYGFVNPYCILISEQQELFYLDMEAVSNEEIQKQMTRDPAIRQYFLPDGALDVRQENLSDELYGMGKTLQYILSVAVIEPKLSRSEERKFQHFISICLKSGGRKKISEISELIRYIPKIKGKNGVVEKMNKARTPMKVVTAVTVLFVATGVHALAFKENTVDAAGTEPTNAEDTIDRNQKVDEGNKTTAELNDENLGSDDMGYYEACASRANIKLALNYFLDLENPTKALSVLEYSEDASMAQSETENQEPVESREALVSVICACSNTENTLVDEASFEKVTEALKVIEEAEDDIEDEQRMWCLVRGYGCLMERSVKMEETEPIDTSKESAGDLEDSSLEDDEPMNIARTNEVSVSVDSSENIIRIGEQYLGLSGIDFPKEDIKGVNVSLMGNVTEENKNTSENEKASEEDVAIDEEKNEDTKVQETNQAFSEKAISEIKKTIAKAYEIKGNLSTSADDWSAILEETTDWGEREWIYMKIAELYSADGQTDKAMDTCVKGLESCYESWGLRNLHIKLLCSDQGIDRSVCAQKIKEYLEQVPELIDNDDFQNLQKEFGIMIDGDHVTVK